MKTSLITILLALYSLPTLAAQVLKVGSGGKVIAISHEGDRQWQVGDEVCVTHRDSLEGCGTVSKVRGSGAIVNMESGSSRITKGDSVQAKDGSDFSSDSSSSSPKSSKTSPSFFALGFHGGAAFATLVTDPSTSGYTTRTGFAFGLTTNMRIASWFYLQPEILYVQKGVRLDTTLSTSSEKLGYLELPILMEFKFRAGRWMPFFQTGPYVGFNLSGTASTTITSSGSTAETDVKNNIKSTEFGAYFGAGVDFLVGNKISINLTTRYSLGLTNVDNTSTGSTSTKTRNFQALGGMRFWF